MIVSNTGMAISSPFSTDLISTTSFRFIRAPDDIEKEDPEEAAQKKRRKEEDLVRDDVKLMINDDDGIA